jgi:hypothetical protein
MNCCNPDEIKRFQNACGANDRKSRPVVPTSEIAEGGAASVVIIQALKT